MAETPGAADADLPHLDDNTTPEEAQLVVDTLDAQMRDPAHLVWQQGHPLRQRFLDLRNEAYHRAYPDDPAVAAATGEDPELLSPDFARQMAEAMDQPGLASPAAYASAVENELRGDLAADQALADDYYRALHEAQAPAWLARGLTAQFAHAVAHPVELTAEGAETILRQEWGAECGAKIATAKRVADKFATGRLREILAQPGIGNNPTIIRWFAAHGERRRF